MLSRSRRTILAVALTAAAVVGSEGCAPSGEATEWSEAELTTSEQFAPTLFRNDFYTYLKRDGHYTDEQIRSLVFMPTPEALTPGVSQSRDNPLAPYDAAYASIRPMDFYQEGLITPLQRQLGPDGPLESELRRNPVHIVIIPGIFGEFIPVSPFEEVFRYGGAASVQFQRKLAELEKDADPKKVALTRDRQYNVSALKDVERSMRDLVRVGSIDDTDGTPLVTITYLRPELGSLETFGTLDENADYYLPRLEKYFQIQGIPEHLYVMGYSRGTPTALNLVSRAHAEHASWESKLKGVITLAGVVYGSQLADAVEKPGPEKKLLDTMVDFVENELTSCEGGEATLALMGENLGHWAAFSARAAYNALDKDTHNAELAREGVDTAFADVSRIASFARRVLFGAPQHVFSSDYDESDIWGVLRMNKPGKEYCENIERFKTTARQIVKGVGTLTTRSRLDWFRTHTLPSNIRYYSITGTMGDATPEGRQATPLVLNSTAYDTHSLDFRSLRGNYYDLLNASQSQLQDSQVTVARGRFWPELHNQLNPAQEPLKTHFMGTVGIHHWGLSFPRAFATRDGQEGNPFPRTLLLKSIATFVAQVERRE